MQGIAQDAAWLVPDSGERVPVGNRLSLGRSSANDIVLPSAKISRNHASIHRQGPGEFWITDLGSQNGTYVNGRLLVQPQRLQSGDRLGFGDDEFQFQQPTDADYPPHSHEDETSARTVVDIRQRTCWLLVGDIEGYSALAQCLDPGQLGRMVGRWVEDCRNIVETAGGVVNKFLGDGFFAYWICREGAEERLCAVARTLRERQERADPCFRFVLHHGVATFSGQMGGEVVIGPEVNFVFRMEKLAKDLGVSRLLSTTAAARLAAILPNRPAGAAPVAGFPGRWEFLTFD